MYNENVGDVDVQINYAEAMRHIKRPYVNGGQYSSGPVMLQLSMSTV